ncbi:hypothetical protein GV791_14930 [Nocardia cyriacigeorgica]|uniref:DUF2744 domain-containing protein n=1 Tax=Nocardia cyriacigeorgica TaxID=135487 RepID=A0A6P1CMQ6_9NOCA|nr:hypothetical protein [Nocardia cyriacigeorgica]NEW33850.1 hypothetical protein [Nocardia cyriacigeorgica]
MTPEELFGENATQVDMISMILDAFPGQRDGVMVPIHPKARRPWAERLFARGLRVHPELMDEFPTPGDHPEAGWMNPHKWVPREKFAEYEQSRPTNAQAEQQLKNMLNVVDPQMLARIESMSDVEKREELARQAPHMGDMLARLNEARAQFERQTKPKEDDDA